MNFNVIPKTPLPAPSPLVNEAVLRVLASLEARIALLRLSPDLDQFRMRLFRLSQEAEQYRDCIESIGVLLRDSENFTTSKEAQ